MLKCRTCWLGLCALLATGLTLLPGCDATPKESATARYQTVAPGLKGNTEKARELNAQATELVLEERYDEATELLKDALTADVTFGPAHNNLGRVYYQKKQYYAAAWEFQYAAKLLPHHAEPRNNLGLVFEAVGDYDKAVGHYEEALLIEPNNPELIGNLTRSCLNRGDRGPEVRQLLNDLILRDTQPHWTEWARDKQRMLGTDGE
jgi:Flp pilus assembly protein TadD